MVARGELGSIEREYSLEKKVAVPYGVSGVRKTLFGGKVRFREKPSPQRHHIKARSGLWDAQG